MKLPVEGVTGLVDDRVSGIDLHDGLDGLVPAVVPGLRLLGQRLRGIDRDHVLSGHGRTLPARFLGGEVGA